MFPTKNCTLFFTLCLFSILCKGSLPNIPTAIAYQELSVLPSGSTLDSTLQNFLTRNQDEQAAIIALNTTAIDQTNEITIPELYCNKKILELCIYSCCISFMTTTLGVICIALPNSACPHLGCTLLETTGPLTCVGCCCCAVVLLAKHNYCYPTRQN